VHQCLILSYLELPDSQRPFFFTKKRKKERLFQFKKKKKKERTLVSIKKEGIKERVATRINSGAWPYRHVYPTKLQLD
jgi:hypothetical protein